MDDAYRMTDTALGLTNPLGARVLLAYRAMLMWAIFLETAYLAVRSTPGTVPKVIGCLIILTALSLHTVHWPAENSRSNKICFSLLEISLVCGACLLGFYRWIWPLYLLVVARAALLNNRKDLSVLVSFTCFLQVGSCVAKVLMHYPVDSWPSTFAIAIASTLMMEAGPCVLVVVVAWLMQSLINEQNLRTETERLAGENEVLGAELERTRIARELHDTLGHSLTSLKIQLELASRLMEQGDARAKEVIDQAEDLAKRSLTDTRVALQSIRNSNFDFAGALQELIQAVKSSGAVELHLDVKPAPMTNVISYQIYRVIQECLTNTLKHARASEVHVTLDGSPDMVLLEVRDNGDGFDCSKSKDGYGLSGMKERVASIHGNVSILSTPTQGTTVRVEVPVRKIESA